MNWKKIAVETESLLYEIGCYNTNHMASTGFAAVLNSKLEKNVEEIFCFIDISSKFEVILLLLWWNRLYNWDLMKDRLYG